jgi:hypothetical protein
MKYPHKFMLLAALAIPAATIPSQAIAAPNDYRWQGDRDSNWDPARHHDRHDRRYLTKKDRVCRGSDGRYYCKRSDGTTGLVLGAVGGGVIGNAVGGGLLGTILGAGGGALLGKHLDKKHDAEQNAKNGYVCD